LTLPWLPLLEPVCWGMGHRIEYFRGGKIIGARVSHVPLEDDKKAVADEMTRYGADFVRLVNIDGSLAEVWSKRRETP
jgi:hypothetical protein